MLEELRVPWKPSCGAEQCLESLLCRVVQCRSALKLYTRQLTKQFREKAVGVVMHARDMALFEQAGGIVLPMLSKTCADARPCEHCDRCFLSKANLHSHMSRRHGIRAELSCVGGSQCAKCGLEFWTTHRLKEHVRHSRPCFACYVSADLGPSAELEQVGCCRQRAWKSPTKVAGPQKFWASLTPVIKEADPPIHDCADARHLKLQGELREILDCAEHPDFASWVREAWKWVHCHPADCVLPALAAENPRAHVLSIVFAAQDVDSSDWVLCEGFKWKTQNRKLFLQST